MTEKKDKSDLTLLTSIPAFEHEDNQEVDDFFASLNTPATENEETPELPPTEVQEEQEVPVEEIKVEEEAPPTFAEEEETPPAIETSEEFNEAPAPEFNESPDLNFSESTNDFLTESTSIEQEPIPETPIFEEPPKVFEQNDSKLINEMMDETFEENKPIPLKEVKVEAIEEPNVHEVISEAKNEAVDYSPAPEIKVTKETFEEIKEFAKNLSYGDVSMGGNPPFSIILKNIQYLEDSDEILSILKEHALITNETQTTFEKSLERGTLLISHISEYSAIYLCHKFRKFNLEIQMGLSDEIHPPKIKEDSGKGLINKKGLAQNKKDHLTIDHDKISLENILVTTTNLIESHEISRYFGVVSEHTIISSDLLNPENESFKKEDSSLHSALSQTLSRIRQVKDLTKDPQDIFEKKSNLKEIYQQLTDKLKVEAIKLKGNAIVGLQYQISPLVPNGETHELNYKLTCTGTVVWAKML